MMHVAHASFPHAGISSSEDDNHFLGFDRMATRDLAIGIILSLQTIVGILGNLSVLCFHLFLYLTRCKFRSTDLIIKNLTIANLLVIFSRGVPQMMACFGLKDFLNDFACRHVFYVHRNNTNFIQKRDYDYCYDILHGNITPKLYVALILCRNGFCLILMVWASGFMVFILHRHKQQVQYIHRKNLSPRSSPESTAMQSILVLVCTFVSLWTLSSIFHICLAVFNNPSLWLRNTSTLIAACFPTVSPYILLSHDARVSWVCFAWNGIQNLLNFS
ncbi:hypothetical protein HPG69_007580 [Diceros bicornis minor]|uniref:Vomeronasal type-1 receptor n=1 Tax=Diceros bicornis minor TaxID=77932 RepID=A0A7J7EFL1_DICBM|nr:hypothetical protein HPG69_007580 [Diceros bicornis minor]